MSLENTNKDFDRAFKEYIDAFQELKDVADRTLRNYTKVKDFALESIVRIDEISRRINNQYEVNDEEGNQQG